MDLHRFQNKWFTSLSDMRRFFPEDYQSQYMRPSEVEIYEIIFLYFLFVYDIFPRKICTLIYLISIVSSMKILRHIRYNPLRSCHRNKFLLH